MSLGGNERFNFIVGMTTEPGDALSRFVQTLEQMRAAGQEFSKQPITLFDQANNTTAIQSARKLAREIHAVMEGELKLDLLAKVSQQPRIPAGQPGAGSFAGPRPLTPDTRKLFEASLGPVERATKTYAEQLSYAAAQLRVKALRANADDAKVLAASAKELEANAALARKTNSLANAREAEVKATLARKAAEDKAAASLVAAERKRQEALGDEIVAIRRRAEAEKNAGIQAQTRQGLAGLALQRRRDIEAADAKKALADQQEAARARAYTFQPEYPNADTSTALGQAQDRVNRALRAQEIATDAKTRTMASATVTEDEAKRAAARLAAADSALDNARRLAAIAETKASGGSFGDQFRLGFKGASDRPYAEQLGQAFKFSVFYGTAYKLLSALTQTFQQTLQEGIEFQQAMTELSIATGDSADSMQGFSRQLGSEAVQAGFAPSQGVLVGARALGLYGLTGQAENPADEAERRIQQQVVATQSARIVSRLALTSGQQPADIQNNIAAIGNAFQTGSQGSYRTADLDAYLTHKFGVAPGSTLVPVSEAGTVGKAAGFSQSEVTAIAAALVARTGQTDTAVSGYLAQIFSRGGEGSLTAVASKYGIDPTAELSDQLKQLSEIYKTASPQDRAELAAVGGRGKAQNAFIALLSDLPEIMSEAKKADTESPGYADTLFGQRLGNLGGQIAQTIGVMKEFASTLGQTGLLDDLGLLVVAFRGLVEASTDILQVWNLLPRVVKDAALAIGALALAAKLAGGRAGLAAIFSSGAGTRVGPAGAGGATGLLTKSNFLIAAVLTDMLIYSKAAGNRDQRNTAQQTATSVQSNYLAYNASTDQIQAHSTALAEAAKANRDAASGITSTVFGSRFGLGAHNADLKQQAEDMDAEAKRLQALAAAHEAVDAARPASKALITDFTSEGLSTSMQAITDAGGTAQDQLDALNSSLLGTADAAGRVKANFDANLFAGDAAESVYAAIQRSSGLGQKKYNVGNAFFGGIGIGGDPKIDEIYDDAIRKRLSQQDVADRTQTALAGFTSPSQVKGRSLTSAARYIVGDAPTQALGDEGITDPKQVAGAQRRAVKDVREALRQQAKTMVDIKKGIKLTDQQLTAAIDQEMTSTQAQLSGMGDNAYGDRLSQLRDQVRSIVAFIRAHAGAATEGSLEKLDLARHELAEAQISRKEDLRRAAQHMAKTDAEVKRIGRAFFNQELQKAIQAGDSNALANLIESAGNWSIDLAKAAIHQAINAARAAIKVATEIKSFTNSALADAGVIGAQVAGGKQRRLKELQGLLGSLQYDTPAGADNVFDTGSDANRPDDTTKDTGPTAAQIAAARQSAYAQGSESQISQARAAMATARADMGAAKKGTVEYYSALGAYLAARNQLTDAIQAYRQNLFLLNHDITNPLVQARAEVLSAAAKLRSDAGKPADVRAADRVALRQAEASQEATAFQQRLETVQTAERLGRISHAAYIRYLENESRRLNHIKNRTFQQQQQLNEIDGLLKDAAKEMEGQFNIAGIKLPTIYQVRRTIAERAGAADGPGRAQIAGTARGQVNSNNTTYIQIDGADYTKVKRLVTDEINKPGRVVTGAPRRRV